ncbi:helix-turn-helix transcriptional regulator [Nonomuraea sp. B12E4]|uniref:helix-turn-helix transcriptional regulator n=1 Tax=Nonomuraea sp. B12E4 TaxID=3153564 RepID=UPI00325DE815
MDMSENAPARPFLELVEATLTRQGKTKTWLSGRANVSRATINNWARQPRTPQSANVLAVADVLGIDHEKALRLAGLAISSELPPEPTDLASLPTPALVEKLHRLTDELARRTQI